MRRGIFVVMAGLLAPGCVALDELTTGVAMWPFLFGTQVEDDAYPELSHLAAAELIVAAVDVAERSAYFEQFPIDDAVVTVSGPDLEAELEPIGQGLYWLTSAHEPLFRYREGEDYTIELVVDGEVYSATAPAVGLLPGLLDATAHPPDSPLLVEMPDSYGEDYDQVLLEVVEASSEGWDDATWSNRPSSATEWMSFAVTENTPAELKLPAAAFPEGDTLYGAALLGLARSRDAANFSDNLGSELSGFTTGSGYVRPVRTAP